MAQESGTVAEQPPTKSLFEDKQILSTCLETLITFQPFQEEVEILRVLAISTVPPIQDSLFANITPWPKRLDHSKKTLFQGQSKLAWTPTLLDFLSFLRCGIMSYFWWGFTSIQQFFHFIDHTYPEWWATWVIFIANTNPVVYTHLKETSALCTSYTSLVTRAHQAHGSIPTGFPNRKKYRFRPLPSCW
jgi:hypothetical protein